MAKPQETAEGTALAAELRIWRLLGDQDRPEELLAFYQPVVASADLTPLDYLGIGDLLELAGHRELTLHALLCCQYAAMAEGSLCLRLGVPALTEKLAELGAGNPRDLAIRITARLTNRSWPELIGESLVEFKPLIMQQGPTGQFLYFQKYLLHEERLKERLRRLLDATPAAPELERWQQCLAATLAQPPVRPDGQPVRLNPEQRLALCLALLRNFVIISGGPGTGKTAIVAYLLRVLARAGYQPADVRLAAPTGRGAQRMTEAVAQVLGGVPGGLLPEEQAFGQLKGETLHRLLGYQVSHHRFTYHARNPLPARLVIVDEVSMVDVVLMSSLCEALDDGARLILLGDKDQLPSVEAGAVLADLVPAAGNQTFTPALRAQVAVLQPDLHLAQCEVPNALTDRVVILEQNYRSAVALRQLAAEINRQGTDAPTQRQVAAAVAGLPVWRFSRRAPRWPAAAGDCHLVDLPPSQVERWRRLLDAWLEHFFLGEADRPDSYRTLVGAAAHYDLTALPEPVPAELVTILDRLFAYVHHARILTLLRAGRFGSTGVNDYLGARLRAALDPTGRGAVFAGAPIMITRNDYVLDLYNGDLGLILQTQRRLYCAVFPRAGGYRFLVVPALPPFSLALAITVHKSQGSEYDEVLLVLPPDEDNRLLCKEIIYTGLTRARHGVVICGRPSVLTRAAQRPSQRESGLDLWNLAGAAPPVPQPVPVSDLPLFADADEAGG